MKTIIGRSMVCRSRRRVSLLWPLTLHPTTPWKENVIDQYYDSTVSGNNSIAIRSHFKTSDVAFCSTIHQHDTKVEELSLNDLVNEVVKDDKSDHLDEDEDESIMLYRQFEDEADHEQQGEDYYLFSASNDNDSEITVDEHVTKRIWLNPKAPIKERVSRFVNSPLGTMHHLDIKIASIDLIRQCGKLRSFEGMKAAQDVLDRLIDEKRHVNLNTWPLIVVPDRPFQYVMYGWANLCRDVAIASQRMREVLDLMIQEAAYDKKTKEAVMAERRKENGIHSVAEEDPADNMFAGLSCEPTVATYNTLIQGLCLAATRSIQAAIEAEDTLSVMFRMHQTHGWHTKPNTRSYSLVLNAYAKCKHQSAGDRAEKVLREMIYQHEQDLIAYAAEYGEEYNIEHPELNHRRIVTPDVIAYTSVIQAHGNSHVPGAPEKALRLLAKLIHSDNPALQVDSYAFAASINVYSKMAAKKSSPSARIEAAKQAEEIWWLLVEELKKIKNDDDNPSHRLAGGIVPFNSALKAYAVSYTEMSPHLAEELLQKLLDPQLQELIKFRPDVISFNTVMNAWANAAKIESSTAPERAEGLLNMLKRLAVDENVAQRITPDVQSYVAVMNAYAVARRNDSTHHVQRLLFELLGEDRERYLGTDAVINAVPFTVLLKSVSKGGRKLLGEEPSKDPFGVQDHSSLLGDGEILADPFSIALATYSDVLNDVHRLGVDPDHFVFSAMLDVIAAHTDTKSIERRQRVGEVFQNACQSGQVSSLVVRSLQNACPDQNFLVETMQLSSGIDSAVSIESVNIFPRHWTRFVPPQFRRVTQRNDHFRKQSKHRRGSAGTSSDGKNDQRNERRKKKGSSRDFIF